MDDRRFGGRRVLVTGGGRGIGRAIALRFAHDGADVLIVGRTPGPLEQTCALANGLAGTVWSLPADVSDADQVRRVVDTAAERGPIDILINNAAVDDRAAFLDIEPANWERVLAVNLTGPFLVAQAVARTMAAGEGGVILNLGSIDAGGADGPYTSYNVTKAGLLGLTRCMAVELAPHGIRVNTVSPGLTLTEMAEQIVGPELMGYLAHDFARVPLRRAVRPEEVAALCAFLASDDAAGITGGNYVVDGGLTANLYVLETLPGA